jgi:hypothetical protein
MGDNLIEMPPLPIISQRAPTTTDRMEVGTMWIDQPNDDTWILTSIVANSATWINAGGGTGTFTSVTTTAGIIAGTTLACGTTCTVGTTLTVSGLGRGLVQSSAAGLFSSSEGTDGQLMISSSTGAPAWATLTAGAGINITNAANAITVTATGAVASTFPTDAGTATPAAGALTVAGGLNINTAGAGSTVTVNLDASPSVTGSLTAGVDLTMTSGDFTVTATTDAAQTIYLHANGGTNETIDIHSDQGTGVSAIDIHADVGGIDIDSGLSTADAINITCSDLAGGIDIDSGTSGIAIDSTGAISLDGAAASNFSVTGALNDLTLASASGSTNITAGEAAANAIVIDATNAGGGIDVDCGTGGMSFVAANGIIAFESGTAAINVGTDAAAHTVTVGSVTGAASTVIQSGTGDLICTSTDDITIDGAGVLELNSSAGAIGIGNDADAFAINVGTGAAARTITVGNVTGATQVDINTGTGGLNVATTGAGDIILNSDDTVLIDADGVLELNSSAGVIGIGNDADAQNINIGTGAAARVITVGNGTGATQVVVNSGTAGVDIGTNAIAQTVTLGNTTGASAVAINSGSGDITATATLGSVIVNSTEDVADCIYLHANAGTTETIRMHSDQGTSSTSVHMQSDVGGCAMTAGLAAANSIVINASDAAGGIDMDYGTGGMTIDATNGAFTLQTGTGAIGLGTDAAAKTITIGNGTGASSVVVDCGTGALNIGTNAVAHIVTIGNVTGATQVDVNAGTGGINLASTGTGDITIDSDDTLLLDCDGVLELNSAAGIIGIGNDADANDINIGTGAAARTVTIGNATGASSVVINAGTGAVNVGTNAVAHTTTVGSTTGAADTTIQAGTGGISLAAAGIVDMTPVTDSQAAATCTANANVGVCTFTGQTPGAGAQLTLTVTNSVCTVGSAILCSVSNLGANDCRLTIERITPGAGSFTVQTQNNGAAACNGDIILTFWIIAA